ncbi:MAG: tRNA glutamyl-Q(34) synthetase GluQRS [Propionibacteriaceae bacterium]|nr:tRNA glutamyl-Q(34) synthetase GluQRS [Propionibacteriaceae bacterium]
MFGRFAPTPSSDLHVGNLRTALIAYLAARSSGRGFLLRIEDLDLPRMKDANTISENHRRDLNKLGITCEPEVIRQSRRQDIYEQALESIKDLVYECYCSRSDIAQASLAPHGTTAHYPGTCRDLSASQRKAARHVRPPALRIRGSSTPFHCTDLLHGDVVDLVDDFVVRRGDGVFSYNFAVVVDDGLQHVDQVVRGDDLLSSAPRQAWLATVLGFTVPNYLHVPLVMGADGARLAKREKAWSLSRLNQEGIPTTTVKTHLFDSLQLTPPGEMVTIEDLATQFAVEKLPRQPWLVDPWSWKL